MNAAGKPARESIRDLVRVALIACALALLPARALSADSPAATSCCPIVELRQYTLYPGERDRLIALFERYFIESQEADGITAIGQFRVLDDPNRFFWLRGFADMQTRATVLHAFYHEPVWQAHRGTANSMLAETDNVLLLHPAHAGSGFSIATAARAPLGSSDEPKGLMVATIYSLGTSTGEKFEGTFEQSIRPVLTDAGARILATLSTEHSPNTYPSLPIRDDANVFAWMSCFADEAAYERYQTVIAADPRWAKIKETFANSHMYAPPEVWRLSATPRSALHC